MGNCMKKINIIQPDSDEEQHSGVFMEIVVYVWKIQFKHRSSMSTSNYVSQMGPRF